MRIRAERRKTIEESKRICLQVREKKTRVIESLHKIIEIMESESLLKKLPEDIKNAKDTIEDSKRGFAELQPQLEEKTAYNNKLKEEVDVKGAKFDTLQSEVSRLKSKVGRQEEKTSAVEGLAKKIALLESERDGVDSRIGDLIPGIESLKNETSPMQVKLNADKEELQRLESEKQRLTADAEARSEKIKGLGDLKVKTNNLDNLNAENNETVEKISKLKADLGQNEQLKTKALSDKNDIDEQVEGIGKEVDNLKGRADSLNKTVIPKEEIDTLQTRLKTVTEERDGLRGKTAKIEEEIENHMKSKGDIIKEVENANSDLESFNDDFNKFKERVELYENDPNQLERLKNRMPELEKIKEEYIKRTENVQEELKHLNNAVDIINTELISYKEAMEEIANVLAV